MSAETSSPEVTGDSVEQRERKTSLSLEISNGVVRLYKEQFGRGPTRTRTYWTSPDLITVTLEDTLTRAERNMVKLGEHQRLRDMRLFFQYASVHEFVGLVETVTGRTVRAFVSGIDTEAEGYSVELFHLHPEGYDGPSRQDKAEF